jgi:hypothetical protein
LVRGVVLENYFLLGCHARKIDPPIEIRNNQDL